MAEANAEENFDYRPYTLPHGTPEWDNIKKFLTDLKNMESLEQLTHIMGSLLHVAKVNQDPRAAAEFSDDEENNEQDLQSDIAAGKNVGKPFYVEGLLLSGASLYKFYPNLKFTELLQNIAQIALDIESLFKESTLNGFAAGDSGSISFSRAQVRCMNAHAFFGTLRYKYWPRADYTVTFSDLFPSTGTVAGARVQCILSYFYETLHSDFSPDEVVTYTRRRPKSTPKWKNCSQKFNEVKVFADTLIEDQPASCQLDFANEHLHIASIIASATQEEVVFSIRPECFPAMLFMDSMDELDSIILSNVQRYCTYSGYSSSFTFTGPFTKRNEEQEVHVLAIDAVLNIYQKQFEEDKLLRDLNKAYSGFSFDYPDEWISTGMWGCGVFNGDPVLKFMQQMMVAAVCDKKMFYSCYLNEELTAKLQELGDYMQKNMKVSDVWKLMRRYPGKGKFSTYVFEKIGLEAPEVRERTLADSCTIS